MQRLSLTLALLPLLTLFVAIVVGGNVLGLGTELLVLSMLTAAAVAGAVAVRQGHGWNAIQESTGEKFAQVLPAVLILLAIGMLIGTWVLSGTIPLLVSWGIQLVNPKYLALTAFLVTGLMSMCTGTSWGSAGTLGVALMGTAVAVEAPLAVTAGAVVSGAYFGDKLSPLSDSTNICAIGAEADLYAHIRHMLYTALPSFGLCLLVYGGTARGGSDAETLPQGAQNLLLELESVYTMNLLVLLPMLVVIGGIWRKMPPALVLAMSSCVALGLGVLLQGFTPRDALLAAVNGFDHSMVRSLGIDPGGLSEAFARLLDRGGLNSMTGTLLVIISAFLLAGALDVSGALDRIVRALLQAAGSIFRLLAATMLAGAVMISLTSHGGVTALILGGLFREAYARRGLAPENLSRSLEDSVTLVEPILPWTVSALFMATTLGVSTLDYLPWAAFCYGGPLFSFLYAAGSERSGFGIRWLEKADS